MTARRYARLEEAELIGPAGLARLQRARVAVVGVGGVGGEVARHLVMLGINVVLIDRDTVSEENLGTQGFVEDDLGRPKVEARARSLALMKAAARVETVHADLARLGLGRLRNVDLIYSCPDNVPARVLLSETACRLGLPWVDAGVDGSGTTYVSRVAAYDGAPDSPCFMCGYDSEALQKIMSEAAPAGCPRWQWGGAIAPTAPTLAISAVTSAVAAVQVIWGLKILLGRGSEVVGQEMFLDLGVHRLAVYQRPRNPDCVFDHGALTLTPAGRPASALSVAATFAMAEAGLDGEVSLRLHRRFLVTEIRCPACGRERRPCRLLDVMTAEDARCGCGTVMEPVPFGLLDRFGKQEARAFAGRTWGDLGLPEHDVVTASRGGSETHWLLE